MALVIPPGFAQIALVFRLAGDAEPMVTTFGVDLDPTDTNASEALRRISIVWQTVPALSTVMSNQYRLINLRAAIGQDGGPPVQAELAADIPGGATSAPLPQNCAILVRKRSALAGREGRGRMYIPGHPETQVDAAGVLDSTANADLSLRWPQFLTRLAAPPGAENGNTLPCPMVLLHTSPQLGLTPPPTPVTSLTHDSRIATQRRRLRR